MKQRFKVQSVVTIGQASQAPTTHVLRTVHFGKQTTRACIRLVAKAMQSKYSTYSAAGNLGDGTQLHANATLVRIALELDVAQVYGNVMLARIASALRLQELDFDFEIDWATAGK